MVLWEKIPKRFRLVAWTTGFLAGTALGSLVTWPTSPLVFYGALALAGGATLLRPFRLNLAVMVIALGLMGYGWAAQARLALTLTAPLFYRGEARVISLRLNRPPQQRVILKLLEGEKKGANLRAYTYDWPSEPGSRVRIEATITPSSRLTDRGRSVLGSSSDLRLLSSLRPPSPLARLRARLNERVGASLPEPSASLAIGLITGAGDDFDVSFREDLQRTGTTHLVAVSGFNLTIVALWLQRLGQRLGRAGGLLLALGGILFYLILAGASPSILRGAVVATLSIVAATAGRITHRLLLILMAAVLLTLVTPLGMVGNLSWQLSFLAFGGIIFLAPLLTPFFQRLGLVGRTLGETLGAEALVFPLLLYQFGTLSFIAPAVNALVLGLIPLAMALSALQAGLAFLALPLGRLMAWVTYPVLALVVKPIQWASALPFALAKFEAHHWATLVVGYGLVFGLFAWLTVRQQWAKDA